MSKRCQVMGIVNVTPDSFSDGGKYFTPEEAIRRARNVIEEGAAIVDVGAESTRPGSVPIAWEEEWSRLEPVLRGLSPFVRGLSPERETLISVDTYHSETAERAVALGAGMINCVYAEPVPAMLAIAKKTGVKLIIPTSSLGSVPNAEGVEGLFVDPMIGFGTTREEDLELLRSVPKWAEKFPVVVGASRKRLVKKLTGEKVTGKNLGGNLGIVVWAAMNGASVVRVHDVRETVQALRVLECLIDH